MHLLANMGGLKESYKSLTEALIHAGANLDLKVDIEWIDAQDIEEDGAEKRYLGKMLMGISL